jgi:hypothetical protein
VNLELREGEGSFRLDMSAGDDLSSQVPVWGAFLSDLRVGFGY